MHLIVREKNLVRTGKYAIGIGGPFLVFALLHGLVLFVQSAFSTSPSNAILLESEKQLKKPGNKAIDKKLVKQLSS